MDILQQINERKSKITAAGANVLFLWSMLILFILDLATKKTGFETEMISAFTFAYEVLFFLIPSIIYVLVKRGNLKKEFRLNRLSWSNAFIVMGMALFLIPITLFANAVFNTFIQHIGRPLPRQIPEIRSLKDFLLGIVIVAGSPAICEEILSRGILMRGYESYGKKTAIVMSALLFSLMHRNIENFIGIFIIGLVLGYVVYTTNSIFAGVMVHFINNSFAVAAMYVFHWLADLTGVDLSSVQNANSQPIPVVVIIFLMIGAVFSLAAFIGLTLLLESNIRKNQVNTEVFSVTNSRVAFLSFIPLLLGFCIVAFEYIIQVYYILSIPLPEWISQIIG